jgi:ribosome-binding factor A
MKQQRPGHRKEILIEHLKQAAAEWIERESNRTTMVTVTDAVLSQDKKRLKILFTVLPDDKEAQVLDFLSRRKRDFFEYVDTRLKVGRMPEISFAVDTGEKNRQRIDFLLKNQ